MVPNQVLYRTIMKILVKYFGVVSAGVFGIVGNALADPCGAQGLPACTVSEPSSLALTVLAIGGVAVIAKYFKKK